MDNLHGLISAVLARLHPCLFIKMITFIFWGVLEKQFLKIDYAYIFSFESQAEFILQGYNSSCRRFSDGVVSEESHLSASMLDQNVLSQKLLVCFQGSPPALASPSLCSAMGLGFPLEPFKASLAASNLSLI